MKVNIKIEKEVDIKILSVEAGVRYWEDATVNGEDDTNGDLIPCRQGDLWCPIIDIDNGIILNWEQGTTAKIHYKVCDCGSYYLKDEDYNVVMSIEEDYVPSIMCPEKGGYGDYIIMNVDENGKIQNWKIKLEDFEKNDE
jgi:hypothetical protein